ncbi:MAG: SpoIIE family protein phosphatase [Candidatus Peregrinibacteria bacterium]
MNFIRKSLIYKALLLFSLLMGIVVVLAVALKRSDTDLVSTNVFLITIVVVLAVVFTAFVWDVMVPLNRIMYEIRHLFSGKTYRRVEPVTVDEIGEFTNFFNEITQDLEKISYDIRERRRMSSELDIAAQIQKDVLPKETPPAKGLDVVARTRTASEVGGDTFDFLLSPDGNQLFIYIGDVTGHGVPAGLVMMMVDTLVTALVSQGVADGKTLITLTNQLLTPRISTRIFMTNVMLRWDKVSQKMYYTGAGHEHILVYHQKTESVDAIQSGGIALGMIPDVSKIVQEKEIPLEIGDTIALYTDGITEAKNPTGEMYGLERLKNSLQKNGYRPSSENVLDSITKDFSQFVGEYVQNDDITMIVLKYIGPEAEARKVQLVVNTEKPTNQKKEWSWTG